ncbi:MAG: hypothetical protein K9M44_02895 [Candidatus Pacebacteria bacterium]|nr:hypothetical protein [Candidatus Paceibacterota bacterium]
MAVVILVMAGMAKNIVKEYEEANKNGDVSRAVERNYESWRPFVKFLNKKVAYLIMFLGLAAMLFNGIFFWADAGKQYFLVYPWGKKDAIMSQGFKPKFFAKVTSWPKWIDIAALVPGEEDKFDKDEMEGIMNAVDIRFIDQVTAKMYPSIRFQIPVDKNDFIEFAVKYRTVENLVYNTLIPATKEQCINT